MSIRTFLLSSAMAVVVTGCGSGAPTSPAPAGTGGDDRGAVGCGRTSVGLKPLTELSGTYQGQPGGLYPNGANVRPGLHDAEGLAIAGGIRPLDASGAPSADGRYALVSIGMSNTTQEFSEFKRRADQDPATHPRLTIVDGAQGGQTADDWANPSCNCWSVLDQRLNNAGVAAPQVAAAWIKMADRQPSTGFPTYAQQLASSTETVLRSLRQRFPNLQLAYLSSRIYAGYATTTLNPEPYAYESAFSVRWVIERQLNGALNYSAARGAVQAPWLSWGPYMWADGLTPRADGLTWACSELQNDGTHPTAAGQAKVADLLLSFFKSDATTRAWFVR